MSSKNPPSQNAAKETLRPEALQEELDLLPHSINEPPGSEVHPPVTEEDLLVQYGGTLKEGEVPPIFKDSMPDPRRPQDPDGKVNEERHGKVKEERDHEPKKHK